MCVRRATCVVFIHRLLHGIFILYMLMLPYKIVGKGMSELEFWGYYMHIIIDGAFRVLR